MPAVTIDREAVGEIGSFDRLTPALFIELTIIYRKEMKEWLRYGERNQEELNRYLEEHPELLEDAMG